ncbi:MAG: hypothetical protein KGL91_01400 [Xanthomonadaceae bacterium]|nr:hypothetical protein [Xanthomonadaceae bacterium]
MNTRILVSALALALVVPFSATAASQAAHQQHATAQHAATAPATATQTAPELHKAMRGLWHGHIVATRDYALAIKKGNSAAANKAADAAVANAKDIANAVAGFYGQAGGDGILKLLAGHWGGVKAMTDAQHAHDQAGVDKAMQALTGNAAELAKFLHTANPDNWPQATVEGLLLGHIAGHKAQIQQVMAGDMKAEATTWRSMQDHMNTIADALADGLARQFPDKAK